MNPELLRHNPDYVRLPGGEHTPMGKVSYWLARDHLLVVEVQFATESYRRFDLREIHEVTLVTTRTHWIKLGFWTLVLLLFLSCGAFFFTVEFSNGFSDPSGLAALCGLGALNVAALTGLLVNQRAGSGCRVEVQTSVQRIVLPGLTRWSKAEKFLSALTPAIQAAQSHLVKPAQFTSQTEIVPSPNNPPVPTEN